MHGPWNDFDPLTKTATKLSFKKTELKTHTHTVEEVQSVTRRIFNLMFRFAVWVGRFEQQA